MLHLCKLRVRNSHGHLRRRHRHHRQRLLRAGHGDPPEAGGDRGLHRARARRRRRRHLALQHLPGLRLRRALAPLLVLVRAQPGLDARPTRASPRSATTCSASPTTTASARTCASTATVDRPRGTRTPAAGRRDLRRAAARARRRGRHGAAAPSRRPRRSTGSTTSRARRSTPPAGTTTTTSRASASPRSAPAPRRSSSCPRSRSDVEQLHVFQRTPPWIMPHPNRPISRFEARLYRRFPSLQKLVRGGVYAGARAAGARLRQEPEADEGSPRGSRAAT